MAFEATIDLRIHLRVGEWSPRTAPINLLPDPVHHLTHIVCVLWRQVSGSLVNPGYYLLGPDLSAYQPLQQRHHVVKLRRNRNRSCHEFLLVGRNSLTTWWRCWR